MLATIIYSDYDKLGRLTGPTYTSYMTGEASSGSFAYDANGNMTRDLSRDITDMEYNALNLPCRATFADGSEIDWLYTASGEKLRQTVIAATGDTLSRRDYLGPYLFVDNEFDRYETTEGYITPDNAFLAYIPDYQGNIVGVYNTSPNAITSIASPLDQHTCYYPYGLPFATSTTPTANRRKYGAKELTPDLGLNAYDFEARTLTPAFPMFSQQDLHAEKYYALSPYLYCAGNPINLVDPTGMAGVRIIDDEAKTITVKANYYVVTAPALYRDSNGIQELKGYSTKDIEIMNGYNDYLNKLNLEVPSGEYEGYTISFDLKFIEVGNFADANVKVTEDKYCNYSIGNTIQVLDKKTYQVPIFNEVINSDNTTSTVGGVTDKIKQHIVMNKPFDSKMNRLHEIFHTLGFTHPKGGGKQGIMKYPPEKPTKKDALEISNSKFLPAIKL